MLYYQGNDGRGGKIRFSRTCTPNAPRSNAMPRLPTPTREYEIRDERGVPLLDPKTGEPMTQKTADNMGSNFDKAMRDRDAMNKKLANEASNNKT